MSTRIERKQWLLAVFALLPVAGSAAAEEVVDVNETVNRSYSAVLAGGSYHYSGTGKVTAWAMAACGHGSAVGNPPDDAGCYVEVSKPPDPPDVQLRTLTATAIAEGPEIHAYGYASASLTPSFRIQEVGGVSVGVVEVSTAVTQVAKHWGCNDGPSWADAKATLTTDPIVFGSATYISYTGEQFDAFPTQFDGAHRYAEQSLTLNGGTRISGGRPGQSPSAGPDGLRLVNGLTISQYVRSGSDDDPANLAGTLVYQLTVIKSPEGQLTAVWTPGTDTSEFAFSFDRSASQIEQDVLNLLNGTTGGDLSVVTARVTMLQDEGTMPNMTLVGVDRTEAWTWGSNNPNALNWPAPWWQGPDSTMGLTWPSSLKGSQVYADDFVSTSPAPAKIGALRWWGTYANEPWTHRPDTPFTLPFAIGFYDSDQAPHPLSLPVAGPPLLSDNMLANRFWVDWMTPSGDALYEFNARLNVPFQPQAGREYFVSIADANVPQWAWLTSTSVNLDQPAWYLNPGGSWTPGPFPDLGFVLMRAIIADFDGDGDVDGDDFSVFEACASGPGVPFAPGCQDKDFDADLDVDQSDFSIFQRCYSGANKPADPDCPN